MTESIVPSDTKAILLLCGYFGGKSRNVKPLSLTEYNKLAAWLRRENLRPEDLLDREGEERIEEFQNGKVTPKRLRLLLERGMELGFAVEAWERQGLWVVGRGDEAYPAKLKKRLREAAPALLFGTGDRSLLDTAAIGVVGSRDADDCAIDFTRQIGSRCSSEGITVVSGGARGVDQESMVSALTSGGSVVAVLAEGVAKQAVSKQYRRYIQDRRLVLVSPYYPEARWTTGNAMGRNKHIYALSERTIVVSSGTKGGTWTGAVEGLKKSWAPVLVRVAENIPEGNKKLIQMGGVPLRPDALDRSSSLLTYLEDLIPPKEKNRKPDLFSASAPKANKAAENQGVNQAAIVSESSELSSFGTKYERRTASSGQAHAKNVSIDASTVSSPSSDPTEARSDASGDLFHVVWPSLSRSFETEVHSGDLKFVANRLNVTVTQLRAWIKQAVEKNLLEKRTRPVKYILK